MRQWGKKVTLGASTRSNAAGEWMFEHCEAVLTPHGGSTVARSPRWYAYLTPGRDFRYDSAPVSSRLECPSEARFRASARSHAAGEWMFEHCAAVLTPHDGSPGYQSPNGYAHLTP